MSFSSFVAGPNLDNLISICLISHSLYLILHGPGVRTACKGGKIIAVPDNRAQQQPDR